MIAAVPRALGAFIGTPMGDPAVATPQLRVVLPDQTVKVGEPIPVKVAYRDFDLRPELRCIPAGPCAGSTPQTLNDGLVQGHIHVYLQRVTGDGFPATLAVSFCIPSNITTTGTGDGVVTGNCPPVTERGVYRVSAEFQSNSHIAILKVGPQDVPTSDNRDIRAIGAIPPAN